MAFISMDLNTVEEPKPVEPGRYDLTIASCEQTKTKEEGKPQFKVISNIDGHDDAPSVFTYVQIPSEMDEPAKAKNKAVGLKRFLVMFGVTKFDPNGFDSEALAMELPGHRASGVELRLKEYNGNVTNELVAPKLKDEVSSHSSSKGRGTPPKRG